MGYCFYERCPNGRVCNGTWAQCSVGCARVASERAEKTRHWLAVGCQLSSMMDTWQESEDENLPCPMCGATVAIQMRHKHSRFHSNNRDDLRWIDSHL